MHPLFLLRQRSPHLFQMLRLRGGPRLHTGNAGQVTVRIICVGRTVVASS